LGRGQTRGRLSHTAAQGLAAVVRLALLANGSVGRPKQKAPLDAGL